MSFQAITPDSSVSLFVKNILVFESTLPSIRTILPFFADGYPGLMFQETKKGLLVNPHKKFMPVLFLYGQTIQPIELEMEGEYQLILFQLYPFALKSLFTVTPQSILDNCYDLSTVVNIGMETLIPSMDTSKTVEWKVEAITRLLYQLFEAKKKHFDPEVKQAVEYIIRSKGQQAIKSIAEELQINSRTLERRFLSETGLSPKQFSQIIQFQLSFEQLTVKDFHTLTDVVYENGFSDQSHFIKVFKAFTGKTPKAFHAK